MPDEQNQQSVQEAALAEARRIMDMSISLRDASIHAPAPLLARALLDLEAQYEVACAERDQIEKALADEMREKDAILRSLAEREEQLETAERDREALAAGISEWLGSQGYSASERAELFSSFIASTPTKEPS